MSAHTSIPTPADTEDPKFCGQGSYIPEFDSIDKRLKRLKDEVLPISPYLLTVPTDDPNHPRARFVNNWAVGKDGPFSPEEQHLQYMTFLMHHEGDSLLVAVGDWSDKGGNIMAQADSKPPSVTSAASTPSTKKKISLNDYKSKAKSNAQAVSTTSEEGKATAVPSGKTVNSRQHTSKSGTRNEAAAKRDHPTSKAQSVNGVLGQKRILERPTDPPLPQGKKHAEPRSPRKPRLSNPKSAHHDPNRSKSGNNGLPALLSPTLPPSSTSPKLPELLSPTLPPDIEEELARLGETRLVASVPHNRDIATKDEGAKVKQSGDGTLRVPSSLNVGNPNNNVRKTDSVGKNPSGGSKSANQTSKELAKNEQALRAVDKSSQSVLPGPGTMAKAGLSPPGHKAGPGIPTPKPELVVKLRYGKSNKKRVEALLKISGKRKTLTGNVPPKPARDQEILPSRKEEDQRASSETDAPVPPPPPAATNREKRPRPVESSETLEPSSKRTKLTTNTAEKPQSSTPTAFKSPSVHQQQQPQGTPKTALPASKDTKGAPSHRPQSGDREVKTPVNMANKTTPGSVEKPVKMSPPTSGAPASRPRENERRAWRDEFQKYAKLGRELKHAADRHARSKAVNENVSSAEEKLATAAAIEAILCFILAFIADDRCKALARQVGDSSTWRSILAYWRVVEITTARYPHLHGLCLLLGAVSHDAIHAIDLERLAIIALPGEHSPVPTPGSDGTTVTSDESKQYRKELLELRSRLPEHHKEAHRLWLEGNRELSEDVIMKEFPTTWSKRSRNFSERGKQQLKVGEYSGEYFLPLTCMTTPVEAVRFGLSILSEWCEKEKVEWERRFDL
jgi:hypothetical protein